jgi:hypothetical protein
MVVFVNLEGDNEELQDIQHSLSHHALTSQHLQKLRLRDGQRENSHEECCDSNQQKNTLPAIATAERLNPNINGFSAGLSCYP